jgi:probable HAF family extracellular repeat protein
MKNRFGALTAFKKKDSVFRIFCFIIAIFISAGLPAFAGIQVEVTYLGTLGGNISTAYGINNSGQIVGESTVFDLATHSDTSHAFLWENGVMTDLGALTYNWSGAAAINDAGQIAGTSGGAFLLQDGIMTGLESLAGLGGFGKDVNDQGQVVGGSYLSPPAYYAYHACLWQNGTISDLGTLGGNWSEAEAINNGGQVAGWSRTADGEIHAFFWENGKMTDLGTLGGNMSEAHGINDKGQVVGFSTNNAGLTRAFIWENGTMRDLDPANPESFSRAFDINNIGQVVGASDAHAALWQYGVRNTLDPWQEVMNSTAYHVNEKGQIVGFHDIPWRWTSNRAVLWTVKGPLDQLKELAAQVAGSDLSEGMRRSLSTMLDNAIRALETDNAGAACGNLAGFMNVVNARIRAISADQADGMLSSAKSIEESLPCHR